MMHAKKISAALLLLTLSSLTIFPASASVKAKDSSTAQSSFAGETEPEENAVMEVEAGIDFINKYGNIILTVSPESLGELGYEPGDLITVRIGSSEIEMPIGTNYSDVDNGMSVCCFMGGDEPDSNRVVLAINYGNMAEEAGLAHIDPVDEEPGYEVVYEEGMSPSTPILLSMSEKQGYLDEYELHRLGDSRSTDRADYPNLSDAEFANFRSVHTTGMGKDTLFRSSSPIDPQLGRSAFADSAMSQFGIRTVFNMANSEKAMTSFPDYALTYYSGCEIIARQMQVNPLEEDFCTQLCDGFRFLASHPGPYLIHCLEGKNRSGFASAVLECLMGASLSEVIEDYMLSFYNFYGIGPDSPQYEPVYTGNILKSLSAVFETDLSLQEDADLASLAEAYLLKAGMSQSEIDSLRANLGADYGGLNA